MSGILDIPSTLSCIKAISHEVDCIQSFCHSLCVLVVDLSNGSDFPNQLAILQCNIFCRLDIPELFYATVSTHRCQIVVKYLSKRCQSHHMDAVMLYLHNTEYTEKAVL